MSDSLVDVGSVDSSVAGASADEVTSTRSGASISSLAGESANEFIGSFSGASSSSKATEAVDVSEEESKNVPFEVCVSSASPGSTTERIIDLGFLISRFKRTRGEIPIKA